ncbi:MAG: hypothetical protein ACXWMU_04580 [Candidatus Limnocylindrales bacterium]
MPAIDHPPEPVRGHKTICIPCSQQQYERIVEDPHDFREFLDRQIEATPELFPPEIRRGYRMKDTCTFGKTGWRLRRIDLRNGQSYLVRPSFLMPYLAGRTEEVQAPFSPQVRRPRLGVDRGTFAELVRSAGSQQEDDHEDQAAAASGEPSKLVA